MTAIPSQAELLGLINDRLTGDAPLMALVGNRIFNHVPQDAPLPILRFRLSQANEWDTKDSAGWEGYVDIDIWSDHRGDLKPLEVADRVDSIFHVLPFTMSSGQSLLLRHEFSDSFTEPDGLTHHTVLRFRSIITN